MTDHIQDKAPIDARKAASGNHEETPSPARKKPGPKPKASRPPVRKEIKGSRIGYADRNKLTVMNRDDENFIYRVVNSDDDRYSDRVATLESRGYNVCNNGEELGDPSGTEASSIGSVASKPVGHGVKGVLMRIPREYYEEDKAAKKAEVDKTEEGMVDDSLLNASDVTGEGLKIEDSKGTRLQVSRRT